MTIADGQVVDGRAGLRRRRRISGAWRCCRRWSTPTPISSCPISASRCPPAASFVEWVRALLALRAAGPDPTADSVVAAAARALDEARGVGHRRLRRRLEQPGHAAPARAAGRRGRGVPRAAGVPRRRRPRRGWPPGGGQRARPAQRTRARQPWRRTLPYSVSPALFRAIGRELDAHPGSITTLHLAESPEEVELLRHGTGPWRPLLDELGAWDPDWVAAADVAGGRTLRSLGFLDRPTLVVHGVQCTRPTSSAGRSAGHGGDVPAKQPLSSASAIRRCGVLRGRRAAWRSAPTAWPARRR